MPILKFSQKVEVPDTPVTCELAVFPVQVVPIALGALQLRTTKQWYATSEDHKRAQQLIGALQVALLLGCLDELIESNRQLYRLLNNIFNKQEYTVVSTDPLVISPAIPTTPKTNNEDEYSIVRRTKDLRDLLDNAINGTRYPAYDSGVSMRVELVRIRELLEQGSQGELDDEMLAELVKIGALLA